MILNQLQFKRLSKQLSYNLAQESLVAISIKMTSELEAATVKQMGRFILKTSNLATLKNKEPYSQVKTSKVLLALAIQRLQRKESNRSSMG